MSYLKNDVNEFCAEYDKVLILGMGLGETFETIDYKNARRRPTTAIPAREEGFFLEDAQLRGQAPRPTRPAHRRTELLLAPEAKINDPRISPGVPDPCAAIAP